MCHCVISVIPLLSTHVMIMNHIVELCLLTKLEDGLQSLPDASDDAVYWQPQNEMTDLLITLSAELNIHLCVAVQFCSETAEVECFLSAC